MVAHEGERGPVRGEDSAVETPGAVVRRGTGDRRVRAGRTLVFGREVRKRLWTGFGVAAERVAGVCIDADLQRDGLPARLSISAKSPASL
jgi:hypothetical protein